MNRTERYLDFMVAVLRADGAVHANERQHLLQNLVDAVAFEERVVTRYHRPLNDPSWGSPEEMVDRVAEGLSFSDVPGLVRDAYIMASRDEDISKPEIDIIHLLLKKMGIPEHQHAEIDAWGREAVTHLSRAEAVFSAG